MTDIRHFNQISADDVAHVGGKGLSLGLMASAALPVPPGFCITTSAYREAGGSLRGPLCTAVLDAYRQLGGGPVAVRSSAIGEDGAVTSFAGQQETFLGITGDAALIGAVEKCWASLHTERARAYRTRQGVGDAGLAMAVVVQQLVPADVAGVLFTRDPQDPLGELMLVEASWGLGEAVVSGKVTPDAFQLSREDGSVAGRRLGPKEIRITAAGEEPVPAVDRKRFCLDDKQLKELATLGMQVEQYYGDTRDIEWAWHGDRFYLLQARPITATTALEREKFRLQEIEKLEALADKRGTIWSRFNLIEILPEPTPMTWSVVQVLLSGKGGTGMMYRDMGFTPSPVMDRQTVYDLIGGRPYCNLSREPLLQAAKPQLDYPFAKYKADPMKALSPEPDPATMTRGLGRIMRLPGFFYRQMRFASRIGKDSKTFAVLFRTKIAPKYLLEVDKADRENLSGYDLGALLQRFEQWVQRTLVEFARDSLKPTLFAQFEMQVIEQQLRKPLGAERARVAVAELCAGAHADPDADFARGIRGLASGEIRRDDFLKHFGHRGPHEMELAQPRWSEDSSTLDLQVKTSATPASGAVDALQERWKRIAAEAKLNQILAKWLGDHVDRLHLYLGLRETAKHYLMRGYAIIRQSLLQFDRHFGLNGGVFFLTPQELPLLVQKKDMQPLIDERRQARALALSLEVPAVVFSDDLAAIGRPVPPPTGADLLTGVPLSAGVCEGPALVLNEPVAADMPPGYILVCPSTDPAWVPLFVHAKGLVMESGGVLSHGAIVAREFGLPAVAGLPDVHRRIKTGQRLRVDGNHGTVAVID